MAYCGKCGQNAGQDRFCSSCGSSISKDDSATSSGGNHRIDKLLMCPKCGGNRCYSGPAAGGPVGMNIENFCSNCDIPMTASEAGKKEETRIWLWGAILGVGGPLLYWLFFVR